MFVRTLVFDQISDSRFSGSSQELDRFSGDVRAALSTLPGVTVQTDEPRVVNFSTEEGKVQSWRQRFSVQKNCVKTTWDDVRVAVNAVKSAKYEFVKKHAF